MSYVRGLGQFAPGGALMTFNTAQPMISAGAIQQPAPVPVPMVMANIVPIIPTEEISHRAPAYVPPEKIVNEAIECGNQAAQPLQDGRFKCVDKTQMVMASIVNLNLPPEEKVAMISGSGQISAGAAKQTPPMVPPGATGSNYTPGAADGSGAGAAISPADFKAVCAKVGGKMGPNCCQMAGGSIGLSPAGQLIKGVPCTPSAGLGGNTALIAGAAIAAVVLMRFL